MSLIKILETDNWTVEYYTERRLIKTLKTDDWIIEYNTESKLYRVSYFEDNNFKDDCWFSSYIDKEFFNVCDGGIHPCTNCDHGWATVSTKGSKSCHTECEELKKYIYGK